MIRIMAFIPCILHMGNRVGIKILTMLAIKRFSSEQGGRLTFEGFKQCTTDCQQEDFYVKTSMIIKRYLVAQTILHNGIFQQIRN